MSIISIDTISMGYAIKIHQFCLKPLELVLFTISICKEGKWVLGALLFAGDLFEFAE